MRRPVSVALDASGNIYVADMISNVIRKVDASGRITTAAGTGVQEPDIQPTPPYADAGDDGPATGAFLSLPFSLAADANGNVFVSDYGDGHVRKIAAAAAYFAGTGSGPLSSRSISIDVAPPASMLGKTGSIFVAGVLPSGRIYLRNASGWEPFNASAPAAFRSGKLATVNAQIASNLDLNGLSGTAIWVGYGQGSTVAASLQDSLTNFTYLPVYRIQ
jgi:hypothetical protein